MKTKETKQILLASSSPRRKELIQLLEWEVKIAPADINETVKPKENAIDYVLRMAKEKAWAAASVAPEDSLIIAADTTVADGDVILGKPKNELEAVEMLVNLRNQTHTVYSAIALFETGKLEVFCVASDVPMRDYSDAEINDYIASGDPFDKAGGYAIQHEGFHPAENFNDCFANVMGLPLCDLAHLGKKFNLDFPKDLPFRCQKNLNYECKYFTKHLRGNL